MSEQLNQLVNSTGDEGPRPEFVTDLRSALAAELRSKSGNTAVVAGNSNEIDVADDDIVIEFDPIVGTNDKGPARLRWLAVAAALIVVAAVSWAVLGLGEDSSEIDTIDNPDVSTTTTTLPTTTTTTTLPGAAAPGNSGDGEGETGDSVQLGTLIGAELLAPGRYASNALGTTITFETTEDLPQILGNRTGILDFADIGVLDRLDSSLTFRRLSTLPDPTSLEGITSTLTEQAWPVDDINGWLEALGERVLVGEPVATTLGGLDATRVEIQVGEPGCGRAGGCPFVSAEVTSGTGSLFIEGGINDVWFVDQGTEDPLAIISTIARPDDRAWFDTTEEFLSSVEFSNVGPNPQRLVFDAEVDLVAFGGVSAQTPPLDFELYEELGAATTFWNSDRFLSIDLMTNPLTIDGTPLASADQLLDIFDDLAYQWTEEDRIDVDGIEARSFSVQSLGVTQTLLISRPDELALEKAGWFASARAYVSVVEHPERGVLFVGMNATENDAELGREFTIDLLESLEFQDSN